MVELISLLLAVEASPEVINIQAHHAKFIVAPAIIETRIEDSRDEAERAKKVVRHLVPVECSLFQSIQAAQQPQYLAG